jgi:hypothetical protein
VKERHALIRDGIRSARSIVFVVVASLAGQRQVRGRASALPAAWPDVLQRKALVRECGRAAALLATIPCSSSDELAKRDPSLSHESPGV